MKNIGFFGIAVLAAVIMIGFTACGEDPDDSIENIDIKIEMVDIAAGKFTMGSPEGEAAVEIDRGEQPQREVTLTGFQMGKYLITQGQYRLVTRKNPSRFQGKIMYEETNILDGVDTDRLPVEQVSWYEAVEFCNRLSEIQGLTPAYTINKETRDPNNANPNTADPKWTVTLRAGTGYRLPTEAQWEYACRAGTTTPFNTGNNITTDQANFNGVPFIQGNPYGQDRMRTTEVGYFDQNAWGLYDMHGNVYELCWDRVWQPIPSLPDVYDNFYWEKHSPENLIDPQGLSRGDRRVIRGGTWRHQPGRLRSAYRERIQPHDRKYGNGDMGFRVVLPLEGSTW